MGGARKKMEIFVQIYLANECCQSRSEHQTSTMLLPYHYHLILIALVPLFASFTALIHAIYVCLKDFDQLVKTLQ